MVGEPAEVNFTLLRTGALELVEWSGMWRGARRYVAHRKVKQARIMIDPADHLDTVARVVKCLR